MTNVVPASEFVNQVEQLLKQKDNPDEWYVLTGGHVGNYPVYDVEQPEEVKEADVDTPMNDSNAENVDGFYQIGTSGWAGDAFEDGCGFVSKFAHGESEMDTRLLHTLVVHEDMLSDQAIDVATGEFEDNTEAPADD